MKLVLASSSPRRAMLLGEADIPFDIVPSSAPEDVDPAFSPEENARAIALRKAEAVAAKFPDRLTLAADTIVVLDGRILGKPADEDDAVKMLRSLSGREHHVMTGMALAHPARALEWSHVEVSKVLFRDVPAETIAEYVKTGEPLDKAGGYAIQGGAKEWIVGYTGSLSNIIGLPMEPLLAAFGKFGYSFDKGEAAQCR